MGQEHENIHLETSACIISQIPLKMLNTDNNKWNYPIHNTTETSSETPKNHLVKMEGGLIEFGKKVDDQLYGWDNEFGYEKHDLKSFEASAMLVSNADFLEFIKDGGYEKKQYWSEPGWSYVQRMQVKHPRWWIGQTH